MSFIVTDIETCVNVFYYYALRGYKLGVRKFHFRCQNGILTLQFMPLHSRVYTDLQECNGFSCCQHRCRYATTKAVALLRKKVLNFRPRQIQGQ